MSHRKHNFGIDETPKRDKQIVCNSHGALGGIFNWNDSEFRTATFDFLEHLSNRGNWPVSSAKIFQRRLLAERSPWPKKRNFLVDGVLAGHFFFPFCWNFRLEAISDVKSLSTRFVILPPKPASFSLARQFSMILFSRLES